MGLFWDLLQQSQISSQRDHAENLESRVVYLENQLHHTQSVLNDLIKLLEDKFGQDIDGDGKVG
jgi:chaperonin cofactor prefoldin